MVPFVAVMMGVTTILSMRDIFTLPNCPQFCFPPLPKSSSFLASAGAEFQRDLIPARNTYECQMGLPDERVEVAALERHLLAGLSSKDYEGNCDNEVLYNASFGEMEDNFVKYQITHWILLSVVLILAWGVGVLMLLYLPIRMYICRREFRSRKLYLTTHAIVYKVKKPVAFPCFGVSKNEKYVILPSVSDVVVEQGYLQSFFGVYSIRIENIGVRRPPSDDLKITGVAHPHDFRKAVLVHILNTRNQNFSRKASVSDDQHSTRLNPVAGALVPLGHLIHEKLDEVEISVKTLEVWIALQELEGEIGAEDLS
ncbi:hypothetical protein EJB05_00931, partial [Eragrostis curvula]